MKTRQGFVSNSSTSSFIIFGVIDPPNPPKEFEWDDDLTSSENDRLEEEYRDKYGALYLDPGYAYGIVLADIYDEGCETTQLDLTLDELKERAEELAKELGVSIDDFKFIAGQRAV